MAETTTTAPSTKTTTAAPTPKRKLKRISGDLFGGQAAREKAQKELDTQLAYRRDVIDPMFAGADMRTNHGMQISYGSNDRGIARARATLANPSKRSDLSASQQSIIQGAQFGEDVLGDEGLGRLGENKDIQDSLASLREHAKGYSDAESLAMKEKAYKSINDNTQGTSRALQRKLARFGVKGQAAGSQLRDVELGGMQQKTNMEQNIFIKGIGAKRQGALNLATAQERVQRFDLGQQAKEKSLIMQAGFGVAGINQAASSSRAQIEAAKYKAATAAQPSCHVAGVKVLMSDFTYKLIEDIEVGDSLQGGGLVKGIGKCIAEAKFYKYRDEVVTDSHLLWDGESFKNVTEFDAESYDLPSDTIVYPLSTEYGCYITESGAVNGDIYTEEGLNTLSWDTSSELLKAH